jgi:hypothetical protein
MWNNQRLLAAIAAMPPEAFIEEPPEDGDLVWRRTVRRLRREYGSLRQKAPPAGHEAEVVELPAPPSAD